MKFTSKLALAAGLAVISTGLATQVGAWPTGPSARAAARLKYNPPRNWIQHYLPDDRYKVAGGIWKVVSTDIDVYYHRANCPNMMRQDAGRVIGFSSIAEAQEAGYRPDRTCAADAESVAFALPGSGQVRVGGRVVMANGKSTMNVPGTWRRVAHSANESRGLSFAIDGFETPRGGKFMVMSMNLGQLTRGADMRRFFTPAFFKQMQSQGGAGESLMASGGVVNTQLSSMMGGSSQVWANSKFTSFRSGGLSGVRITPATGKRFPNNERQVIFLPEASTVHILGDMTRGGKDVDNAIRSFRP